MSGFVSVHGWDLAQIWILAGLFAISFASNAQLAFTAARRTRPMYLAITLLALLYSLAYVVLVLGPYTTAEWTRVIRYPGWVSAGFVWTWLPRRAARFQREAAARAVASRLELGDRTVELVAEKLGVPLDDE